MSTRDRAPAFAVLDVVRSLLPADQDGLYVVAEVRRYVEGHYRYCVGSLDASEEAIGGIYDEDHLASTGRRASIEHFWTVPCMARQIVRVSDAHPTVKLRGLVGEIRDQADGPSVYSVVFTQAKGFDMTTRALDIPEELLELTGHRQPPEPVPRPVTTYRPGRDQANLWPSHEFDIVDEIDQYL